MLVPYRIHPSIHPSARSLKGDDVAYDRSVGQAVIQFHGPPRAFSAVRMVDVCFHPEAQFSGTVPLGMVVAASRTVP